MLHVGIHAQIKYKFILNSRENSIIPARILSYNNDLD